MINCLFKLIAASYSYACYGMAALFLPILHSVEEVACCCFYSAEQPIVKSLRVAEMDQSVFLANSTELGTRKDSACTFCKCSTLVVVPSMFRCCYLDDGKGIWPARSSVATVPEVQRNWSPLV